MKYYENGVARIIANDKPFAKAKAHFADAMFYFEKCSIKVDDIASVDVGLLEYS